MDKFQEILKELVDETGLSLRKLGEKCGVPSSQLSRYLKGSIPTLDVVERLATCFNCSVDFLFGIDETRSRGVYKPYDMSVFLERYGKVLKENKITHWKFCQELHLSESNLRKWRKGHIPSTEILIITAKELSTSVDWLIGRK